MHFQGRELKPFAEPIPASALEEGEIYFSVQFIDEQMLIPNVEPLAFIGRNLNPGDAAQLYFQDAGSYLHGLRYESSASDGGAEFYQQPEAEIGHIFEFDHALDVLLTCSLRRQEGSGR